ncbi:hypothetical protein EB169_11500, partial [archaeon]|nr:hypothetical protein [archaeon]
MIYDYYVDKRRFHKQDSYVDIILDYPIEVTEYEYLRVKLCDFKFLNNIYNISSALMNNQFNIRRYSKTYTYTFGNELYLSETGFFDDATNNLLVSEVINTADNTSEITYGDLTLLYFNSNDITDASQSYWQNILKSTTDGANRKLELIRDLAYFEFETSNILTSLETSFYKNAYTGSSIPLIDINFERFNDNTNQYELIENVTLEFPGTADIETLSHTFTNSNP